MNKINIIAICGKAGAGKDTLLRKIMQIEDTKMFLHEIVSCTTRPPREGEVNGVNYHFMTNEEFAQKILKGEMLEATIFNDWCYGTALQSLDVNKVNIGVFNPEGIETLLQDSRINLRVYYVDVPSKERLIRQLNREEFPDVDEIIRRYKADEEDFMDLDFNYYTVFNDDKKDTMTETVRDIIHYALSVPRTQGQEQLIEFS